MWTLSEDKREHELKNLNCSFKNIFTFHYIPCRITLWSDCWIWSSGTQLGCLLFTFLCPFYSYNNKIETCKEWSHLLQQVAKACFLPAAHILAGMCLFFLHPLQLRWMKCYGPLVYFVALFQECAETIAIFKFAKITFGFFGVGGVKVDFELYFFPQTNVIWNVFKVSSAKSLLSVFSARMERGPIQ